MRQQNDDGKTEGVVPVGFSDVLGHSNINSNKSLQRFSGESARSASHDGRWWTRLIVTLYLLACIIKLRLQFRCRRLECVALRFQCRLLTVRNRYLLFKQRNMVTKDGCRTMFTNPFFNCVEWVHIFCDVMWPNDQELSHRHGESGEAQERRKP